MAELLLGVMGVAAAAYVILAGADFGVGMVQPLLARLGHGERVDGAIAPVWEANHVWLVLVAVLAFVGFPEVYVQVTTYLHVPLLMILLGIVARGSAFTFRHYDPDPGAAKRWYSAVFVGASYLTPLFLGVVVAAIMDGRIGDCRGRDFVGCYIVPWNTGFGWATGAFLCALFAFEGTALLAAEHAASGREGVLPYVRVARRLHVAVIAAGGAVFMAAHASGSPWLQAFRGSPRGIAAIALASAMVPVVALSFHRRRPQLLRMALGAQTAAVMFGYFAPAYPILVRMADGRHVQMPTAAAPAPVLEQLTIAVGVGLAFIVPGLVYLIAVYKRGQGAGELSRH